MKLQKLCYYSQAWGLVWNNQIPLFEQDFQAWRDGPVNKELFDLHKGKFVISSNDIPNDMLQNSLFSAQTDNVFHITINDPEHEFNNL